MFLFILAIEEGPHGLDNVVAANDEDDDNQEDEENGADDINPSAPTDDSLLEENTDDVNNNPSAPVDDSLFDENPPPYNEFFNDDVQHLDMSNESVSMEDILNQNDTDGQHYGIGNMNENDDASNDSNSSIDAQNQNQSNVQIDSDEAESIQSPPTPTRYASVSREAISPIFHRNVHRKRTDDIFTPKIHFKVLGKDPNRKKNNI